MRTLLPLLSCFAVLLGEASAVTLTMSGAVGGAVAGGNFEVATVGTAAATNNYPSG